MTNNTRPQFTEDHEIFRKTVRSFVEKELLPHKDEWENNRHVPKEVFKQLAEQGFLGINHPEKYGGSNCDYWYKVIFCEEMMRCRMNGFLMDVMVQTDMTTSVVNRLGTEEQKQEILVPAIQGEKVLALGITEPGGGSDVAHLRTKAVRDGDDYIINGAKTFITNGSRCDYIVLAVRTGDAVTKENFKDAYQGVSLILFPTKDKDGNPTPGFKVGRKLEKLGNHSSDTAELAFEDCRVPAQNILGEENRGFYYIMTNFQGERLVASIMCLASSRIMIDDALKYGRERMAFGRPILNFQVWRHRFAQMLTEVEAAQELTYRAADLYNQNIACVKEISMAKLLTSELANKIANECLQFHGGYGYMAEYDISRFFRDLRLIPIGAGTSEIMREIIAKEASLF